MPVNIWCGIRVACTNDWTPSTYSQPASASADPDYGRFSINTTDPKYFHWLEF